MSKLLVVFGATGQQGGAVANYVINDPELSKEWKVRGVTRDASKPAAKELEKKGIQMVNADVDDEAAVKAAVQGAHAVFIITVTIYAPGGLEQEIKQGKSIADSAVAAGAKLLIWSSQPNTTELSKGKWSVDIYDTKNHVEQYIRSLPVQSAFFDPGSFMQNFQSVMAPRPAGDGTYAVTNITTPDAKWPWIDIEQSGNFIGAVLADPDKYNGKVLYAATYTRSMDEVCEILSKATGKTIKYNQIPADVFRGFLPPNMADQAVKMFTWFSDYGYYGPETVERVEWSAKQARGKLNTFEDFLQTHSLNLE